jgi:hypothetical protein
MAVPMVDY